MRLTAVEEYGLRCLLQLARRGAKGSMTIGEISQAEGLTVPYIGKIMRLLRQGDFVCSVRGHTGGYALSRPPSDIYLGPLFNYLGGKIYEIDFCERHAGQGDLCIHSTSCSIRAVLSKLQSMVDHFLEKISLQDLLKSEGELSRSFQREAVNASNSR